MFVILIPMIILKGNCITALKEEITVELNDARSYSICASGSLIGWSGRVSDLILSSRKSEIKKLQMG